MKERKGLICARWFLLLVFAGAGAVQAMDAKPMIKAGLDFGGDTLATAVFTNGDTQSIRANEGLYFGAGASILNDEATIETELSLSYKTWQINASNGKLTFTRLPVDALVFYRWPKFRAGGGLTYHLDPRLDGSGVASNVTTRFDNALGFALQADYLLTPKVALGLRYTNIEYKATGNASGTVKGDGIGIEIGIRF